MTPAPSAHRRTIGALLMSAAAVALVGCAASQDVPPMPQALAGEEGATAALLRVARGTRDMGDLAGAATLYKRLHLMAPERADVLVELAQVLAALDAHNEAVEAYRRALEAEPASAEALRGLGNALIALNQPQAAIEHFHAALALREDARLYNGLGVAHDIAGAHERAQASYRNGLGQAPNDPALRNNLALSLALSGDHATAVALLSKLVNEPHATPRQRQNLALVYGLAGRSQDAAKIARVDLDERTVQNNLAYYETLRGLPAHRRAAAVFGVATLPPMPPARKPEPAAADLPETGAGAAGATSFDAPAP